MIPIVPGQKYGRLTVLGRAGAARGYKLYRCRCECGNEKVVVGSSMVNGQVRSCGCLKNQFRNNKARRLAIIKAHAGITKVERLANTFARVGMGLKSHL